MDGLTLCRQLDDSGKDRQCLLQEMEVLERRVSSQSYKEADTRTQLTAITNELTEAKNQLNMKDNDGKSSTIRIYPHTLNPSTGILGGRMTAHWACQPSKASAVATVPGAVSVHCRYTAQCYWIFPKYFNTNLGTFQTTPMQKCCSSLDTTQPHHSLQTPLLKFYFPFHIEVSEIGRAHV